MREYIVEILRFVGGALSHSWWLLLITVPVSVVVNVSGAAKHVRKVMSANIWVSILLATLVGSISPLCSCTVIPLILSLLTGGVPLAPVMAFWIASPSMDVEVFFLSVSTLGWELAVWRLASTFLLSILAGVVTHALVKSGWIGEQVLRADPRTTRPGLVTVAGRLVARLADRVRAARSSRAAGVAPALAFAGCSTGSCGAGNDDASIQASGATSGNLAQSAEGRSEARIGVATLVAEPSEDGGSCEAGSCGCGTKKSLASRILTESLNSMVFVGKFLLLAFVLEALIVLFVPERWIATVLGPGNPLAVPAAALVGLPAYVTNLSALGMLGGMLQKGMMPGAALAFLISGPTTTLPAMSAVFGIASRRVFALYLGISLGGALFFGLLYTAIAAIAG